MRWNWNCKTATMCLTASGGVRRVSGREALAQRIIFRLDGPAGKLPLLAGAGQPPLSAGSLPASQRAAAAVQYVTEALAQEPVAVEDVGADAAVPMVSLSCERGFPIRAPGWCDAGGAGMREDINHEDCGRNL